MKACPKCNFENQDESKFCAQCGEVLTEPVMTDAVSVAPVKRKRWIPIIIALIVVALVGMVIGMLAHTHVICLEHEWEEATCTDPKTCFYCGETEGEELGHKYDKATCTLPETCSRCSKTKGKALGHSEGSWTTREVSTLTSGGTEVRKCTACSQVLDTRTTAKKTPAVVGKSFNFTDAEFISWYNTKVNSYVSSIKLSIDSETVTGYRVTTKDGEVGVMMLSHKGSVYGNVTAVTFTFDDSSMGWAHAAHVGTNISSSFNGEDAAYYYVRNSNYSAGGMTLLKLDIGTQEDLWTIAPTDFVYD